MWEWIAIGGLALANGALWWALPKEWKQPLPKSEPSAPVRGYRKERRA